MAGVTADPKTASVNCAGKQVSITLSANGTDGTNATTIQSFTVGNSSKGGTFSNQNPTASGGTATITYTSGSGSGHVGTDTITYTATDGTNTGSATITITINATGSFTDVDTVCASGASSLTATITSGTPSASDLSALSGKVNSLVISGASIANSSASDFVTLAGKSNLSGVGSTNITVNSGTPTLANLTTIDNKFGTVTVNTGSTLSLTGTLSALTTIESSVTFSNNFNGTVNDTSGLNYTNLNTLLGKSDVNGLTVSAFTDFVETASNANSLVSLSTANVATNKIVFKANSQITSSDTSFSHTIINAIFTDTGGKFTKVILNNDTTLTDVLTIPASHTLEVKSGKTLTLEDVLSNSGTLTNGGTVKFNANSGLTATGATTLGGAVTINGDSTFTATGSLAITNAFDVGGNTLTLAGAGALSGGAIQLNNGSSVVKKTGTGSVANAITLSSAGAKLDIDANTSISGNITMSANATFDIGSNTLTYSGAAIDVGANTLTLTGSGTISNTNNINLNATASLINFAGATVSKLNQGADAASGKGINVATGASTITTFTSGGQSRIALGANLTITNAFSLGARTMILSGSSTLGGGKITLDNASSLIQVTAGCTISSDIAFTADSGSGKGLDINSGCTISGDLTTSADAIIDVASGQTLTYSGAAFAVAANTLNILGGGTIANSNAITFTSGELDVDANNTISGAITISGDATFDIGTNTLTYSGAAIDVGGNTLTIDGTGTITNTNDIQLNNANSLLKLTGATISKVKQSADAASGKGIDVATNNSTITTFTSAGQSRIKLGKNLTITNAFNLGAETMILNGTQTIDGGKISLNNADSLIQVTENCTIDNDLAFTADSNSAKGLDFNDDCTISGALTTTSDVIIDVASGKTLTYSGAAFAVATKTLNLVGDGTINNSNAITFTTGTLDVDGNIEIDGAITISGNATIDIANGKTLNYDGASLAIGANTLKLTGGTGATDKGTLDNANAITISTGTLDVDNNFEIDGNITISGNATIDIANGKTLDYDGASLAVGTNTLKLTGGTGANDKGTLDNDKAITISTGKLDVDNNFEIDGDITISGNATIDIANGKTLDYDGASLAIGTNTLTFTGGTGANDKGKFDNANALTVSTGQITVTNSVEIDGNITMSGNATISIANGKTLDYDGASLAIGTNTLTFTGGTGANDKGKFDNANALTMSTGQITVTNSVEIDGDITMSGNATISIANGKTLDYDGASLAVGTNTLKLTGGTGATDEGKLDNANAITFSTGTLDVDNNIEIDGDITISDDATFDIASGKTLDYDGAQINIGDNTLSVIGGGTITNANNITLSHANSLLNVKTNAGMTIAKVSTSANVTGTNKGVDVDVNATITTLTVAHTCPVRIASGVTLSGAISVTTGTLSFPEAGTVGSTLAFSGTNNTGSTISTANLGINSESKRYEILGRIFAGKTTMTQFRTTTSNLNLDSSISQTNVNVYKGQQTAAAAANINLNTAASNVSIYGHLPNKNDIIKFTVGTGPNKTTYTVTKTSANGTVGTNATFSVNGGNQTTTHTGGQSKIVGNSPQFTLVFGGVAVAAGAGTAEVASGGDPYICPCYGPTYKLPDRNAFYRLYENNDIIINGEVKEISESRKNKLIAYNKKKGFGHLDAVIKDIYLFRSIYVSVGQHKLAFNLEKINWVTTSNSKKFFKVSKPSGVDLESEWFVGGEDGAAHMKISWMYENEPMHINLYFFNDPQKENGISLKGMTSVDSLGLFIRNYNPKTMEIPSLAHMESVEEQYENATVKFTNKPIKSKGEVWMKY